MSGDNPFAAVGIVLFCFTFPIVSVLLYLYGVWYALWWLEKREFVKKNPYTGWLHDLIVGAFGNIPYVSRGFQWLTELSEQQARGNYDCYSDDPEKRRTGRLKFAFLNPRLALYSIASALALSIVIYVLFVVLMIIIGYFVLKGMGERHKYRVTRSDGSHYITEKNAMDID